MTVATDLQPFLFQRRSWPAHPRHLAPMRAELRCWLESSDLDEDLVDDLVMAMSEAASNAIEHAYRPITAQSNVELTLLLDQDDIDIEIVDHGRWQPPATHDTGRGRGIAVIQHLVEAVIIHFDVAGTRVTLHHPIPARSAVMGPDVDPNGVDGRDDPGETLISA